VALDKFMSAEGFLVEQSALDLMLMRFISKFVSFFFKVFYDIMLVTHGLSIAGCFEIWAPE
jgi:hypothetical protein